jgi:hypothetical protein
MIIAFGQRSRTGKDAACELLLTYFRSKNIPSIKTAWASPLKDACHKLYGWAGVQSADYYEKNPEERKKIIPALNMNVVELWIVFGTHHCRQIHTETFARSALHGLNDSGIILFSDTRFMEEFNTVKQRKGVLIRIDRDSAPLRTGLSVDHEIPEDAPWDFIVKNNGTLRDLYNNLMEILKQIGHYHG